MIIRLAIGYTQGMVLVIVLQWKQRRQGQGTCILGFHNKLFCFDVRKHGWVLEVVGGGFCLWLG